MYASDVEKYSPEAVGERIRQVRKNMHLSQEAFAEFLGMSQDKVSRLETGKCANCYSVLQDISMRTEMPLLYFYEGEEIFEYYRWKEEREKIKCSWKEYQMRGVS